MSDHQADYPIATMCQLLGVSSSGYYAWRKRQPSPRSETDVALIAEIQVAHAGSRGTYGAPRIHAELAAKGTYIGRKRVARLMTQAGLAGVSRRRFVTTTVKDGGRQAPDLVERNFTAEAPDRLWVADITYIPTWAGFLYLAVVLALPPSNASFSHGTASGRRPKREAQSSTSSRGSTIRAAATPRSDIFPRWTLSNGVRRRRLIPTHVSLPPCSRPSRTSPPGGPKRGPSLTAAARDGRTIVRAGTEEWLRRGPNQRMARHRRATCRQITSPNPKRSTLHETGVGPGQVLPARLCQLERRLCARA